jgi:hypothetical protein
MTEMQQEKEIPMDTHHTQESAQLSAQPTRATPTSKAYRNGHRALLILCIFVGAGALFGGVAAYIAPNFMGAQQLVPIFQALPVIGPYLNSLVLPASALLLFVFLPQAIASLLLLRKQPSQFTATIICGLMLSVFIIVELIVLPNFLAWFYLALGVAEIAISVFCSKRADKLS